MVTHTITSPQAPPAEATIAQAAQYIGETATIYDELLNDVNETLTTALPEDVTNVHFYVLTNHRAAVADALAATVGQLDVDDFAENGSGLFHDYVLDAFFEAEKRLMEHQAPDHYHYGGIGVAIDDWAHNYAYPTISEVLAHYGPQNVTWLEESPTLYCVSYAPAENDNGGVGGTDWTTSFEEAQDIYTSTVRESAGDGGISIVRLVKIECPITGFNATEAQLDLIDRYVGGAATELIESTGPALRQYIPSRTNPSFVPTGGVSRPYSQ